MSSFLQKIARNRLTIPFTPFYRHYPYNGGISINSADARGCVDSRLGFFCNRIPKAANSTIVENLARLSFGEEVPSKLAKKRFTLPSQLSRQDVKNIQSMFCFAVVRNPYTRTLSAYLDKVERRALRKGRESSFKGFLRELDDGALYSNAHWAPQSSLLLLPAGDFEFFGKVENLNEDLAFIKSRILGEQYQAEPMKSVTGNATGAAKKLAHYYDEQCVQLVQSMFERDFQLFGYSTDFPA